MENLETVQELITKVHEDIEGRYDLDGYDLGIIHSILCDVVRMIEPPAVLAVNLKDMDLNLRDEFKKNWEEIIQAQIDKFWDSVIESKPIIAETIPEEYTNNPETARNQDVRDRSKI